MAHYLQYWKPQRAAIAFGESDAPIARLANGWFPTMQTGDLLWLLTSLDGQLVLALRAVVAKRSGFLRKPPPYAVGNSKTTRAFELTFKGPFASACAIPFPMRTLRRLRFESKTGRLQGPLNEMLKGPLSALQPLADSSSELLEACWLKRNEFPWIDITVSQGGRAVFATVEHRLKVERIAIRLATKALEKWGWEVKSVEADRIGYDLHCTTGEASLLVEVKGTADINQRFFMTKGEHDLLLRSSEFALIIVSNALKKPKLSFYTAVEARKRFVYVPNVYSAALK